MPPKKYSKKYYDVLRYIRAYYFKHGYPPCIREIGEEIGKPGKPASTSVVNYYLRGLRDLGKIKMTPGVSRSYVPIRKLKKRMPRVRPSRAVYYYVNIPQKEEHLQHS